jgi:hypothetical protein
MTSAIKIARTRPPIADGNPKTPIIVKKKMAPTAHVAKILRLLIKEELRGPRIIVSLLTSEVLPTKP